MRQIVPRGPRAVRSALHVHETNLGPQVRGDLLGDAERILRAAGSSPPRRAAAGSSPSPRRWEASPTCSSPPRARPSAAASAAPAQPSRRCAPATRQPRKAPGGRFDGRAARASSTAALRRRAPARAHGARHRPDLLLRRAPLGAARRRGAREARRPGARRRRAPVARHRRQARRGHLRPQEERPARAAAPRPLLAEGVIPVVTGFIARSAQGETTTLGRSGSDTTAALLGAALGAREVVIWTDVDGVLSADPRLVPGARLLTRLSYREAAEMTYFGAKVLHFPAVLPAIAAEIPLVIRNSFRPERPGRRSRQGGRARRDPRRHGHLRALPPLARRKRDDRHPGIAARVFGATARLGVSVVMFSQASSEQNIALVVPEGDRARTVAALEQEFRYERLTGAIDGVTARAADRGRRRRRRRHARDPGIAAKVFAAVARARRERRSDRAGIARSATSPSRSTRRTAKAVKALHRVVALEARAVRSLGLRLRARLRREPRRRVRRPRRRARRPGRRRPRAPHGEAGRPARRDHGRRRPAAALGARNTAAVAAAAVLEAFGGRGAGGLELTLEKGLPLSSGLGSSAASAAAGAHAAGLLLGVADRRRSSAPRSSASTPPTARGTATTSSPRSSADSSSSRRPTRAGRSPRSPPHARAPPARPRPSRRSSCATRRARARPPAEGPDRGPHRACGRPRGASSPRSPRGDLAARGRASSRTGSSSPRASRSSRGGRAVLDAMHAAGASRRLSRGRRPVASRAFRGRRGRGTRRARRRGRVAPVGRRGPRVASTASTPGARGASAHNRPMPAPTVAARFRCVACAAEFPLAEPRTACAACGELLDVVPDLESFGFSGAAWRDLFERRRTAPARPRRAPSRGAASGAIASTSCRASTRIAS